MLKHIITLLHYHIITFALLAASCNSVKRDPGKTYMPDMAYSRAYEAYSVTEEQKQELLKKEYILVIHLLQVLLKGEKCFHFL